MNNGTEAHGTQILTFSNGELVRYTIGDEDPEVPTINVQDVRGLSDNGSFCGYQSVLVKRNRYNQIGYWYDETIHDLSDVDFAQDINGAGDVIGDRNGGAPILHHAASGPLDVDQLVISGNEAELTIWANSTPGQSSLTDRNVVEADPQAAGFPAIAGRLRRDDLAAASFYDGYVLIPTPAP